MRRDEHDDTLPAGAELAADAPWQPAFLLGVGLGGFVDGILLHQKPPRPDSSSACAASVKR
jgi:hypothetical protein